MSEDSSHGDTAVVQGDVGETMQVEEEGEEPEKKQEGHNKRNMH
jgi:hypothetical protein